MATIIFGSDEARAVLTRDRDIRNVEVLPSFSVDQHGRPMRYVAATWADWEPEEDDDWWNDHDEPARAPSKEEFAAVEEAVERSMAGRGPLKFIKGGS